MAMLQLSRSIQSEWKLTYVEETSAGFRPFEPGEYYSSPSLEPAQTILIFLQSVSLQTSIILVQ